MKTLQDVHGVGASLATVLERNGFGTVESLAAADPAALAAIRGLGARRAPAIVSAAQRLLAALTPPADSTPAPDAPAAEPPAEDLPEAPHASGPTAKPAKTKASKKAAKPGKTQEKPGKKKKKKKKDKTGGDGKKAAGQKKKKKKKKDKAG